MNSAVRNTLTISGIWSGHCIIILPLSHGYLSTKDGGQFSTKKVTDFIHRLDPSRLVDSASGWFDQGCGDINSLHYYFLGLPVPESDRVLALSEFGGYSLRLQEHSACKNIYGYKKFTTSEALTDGFSRLMENTIVPSVKKDTLQLFSRSFLILKKKPTD